MDAGPYWPLLDKIDGSEIREIEPEQGGFCVCTASLPAPRYSVDDP